MPFPWFAWPGTVMTASPVNIPRRGEWLLWTSGFCFISNPCRSITNKLWCYWTKTLLTVSFVLDPFFFLLWQQSCFVSTDLGEVVKDRAERDAVRHFQTYSYSNPFHFFFFHSFFFFFSAICRSGCTILVGLVVTLTLSSHYMPFSRGCRCWVCLWVPFFETWDIGEVTAQTYRNSGQQEQPQQEHWVQLVPVDFFYFH